MERYKEQIKEEYRQYQINTQVIDTKRSYDVEYLIYDNIRYRRYLINDNIVWFCDKEMIYDIYDCKELEHLYQNMLRVEKLERILKNTI